MSQIVSYPQLLQLRHSLHFQGKSVVLATGVFDLFHQEHRHFLAAAKAAGDILVVGLETDDRVRRLKGTDRPVNNLNHRLTTISRHHLADYVFALPEDFGNSKVREDFILNLKPHILAVSASTPNIADKRRVMKMVDGEVRIVLAHNPAISTTQLLAKKSKA